MANLADIEFKEEYRSDNVDLIAEFYIPCLSSSILYRRAVGYFTSNSIQLAMRGVTALIENGGKMQLIASPYLSKEDIEAIENGYKNKNEVIENCLSEAIPNPLYPEQNQSQWECLAWMISTDILDIQIALARSSDNYGIYHEKLGIFTDSQNNHVAFSGSANETSGGLISNFETVDVFTSWRDSTRTTRKIDNFEKLWNNETNKVEIVNFPEACRQKILKHTPATAPQPQIASTKSNDRFEGPKAKPLREYQKDAINNWLSSRGRGVLQMATGAGKTITGLSAAQVIHANGNLDLLLIVCPYKHLVTQWAEECRSFGLSPILCYKSKNYWMPLVSKALASMEDTFRAPTTLIVSTSTFITESFQSRFKHFPTKTMILADEVHNMGAGAIRKCLPESIPLRLGLSATPERWFDEEGTAALYDYFGQVLEPIFSLKDALDCGALCHYYYFPILVSLNEEEAHEYLKLSKQIAQLAGRSGDVDGDSIAEHLLIKRARLIATAEGKEAALQEIVKKDPNFKHCLFYCGDGTVEGDDGDMQRHVDFVVKMLSGEFNARVAKFTSENSMEERDQLLKSFAKEDLQGLVAIRCLDEGVDVPSTRTAVILASSTNPRQFIQRRGRILRQSPEKKDAVIYDMVVYPPQADTLTEAERSLVRKELVRLSEFAALAKNAPQAKQALWKLQEHFHLTDI
jgi:DNA phosphorothioation system restriction enzyme